jgi:hypothetical protein
MKIKVCANECSTMDFYFDSKDILFVAKFNYPVGSVHGKVVLSNGLSIDLEKDQLLAIQQLVYDVYNEVKSI